MKTTSIITFALVISAIFSLTAAAQPSLGTGALLEGPGAGSDSVVLAMAAPTDTWTALANDAWLHLGVANQSGMGSTNVVFSCDANPAATRTGTLTIAGQTLTVTQAGTTCVAAPLPVTTLVAPGPYFPDGLAVDGAGNVYFSDSYYSAIKKWTAANNTLTTLIASGLNDPISVAVDGAGNVYIADSGNNAIKKWTATNNTVTTLVASGLNDPVGVAVDGAGNVYIADMLNNAIKKWTATNNTVTTLVASGLNGPWGVAVDGAGNVYIADRGNNAIKKWTAAGGNVTALVATGLNQPSGVAVDGAGNVYIADSQNNAIKKWTAAGGSVTTLVGTGLSLPWRVAVDGAGSVYIADSNNKAVKELPHAFVDSTAEWESASSGSDVLPVVLPSTANLLPPFSPTSDQPWLTLTGVSNGVVSFAFGANTGGTNRTGHITVLGQPVSITQRAGGPILITGEPASLVVCAGSPALFSVTATGDSLGYQWQVSRDGGNTFTNISATATNVNYTNTAPTAADNGSQYRVVVSTGGVSATSAPPAVLTVNTPATASAGANQTICSTASTSGLGGSVDSSAAGGLWTSSGTGTFAPNATTLNASYTPSAGDSAAGSVTLTLTAQPCSAATAQLVVTITSTVTASAGVNQTICAGSVSAALGGSVGGGTTGGVWTTTGTGTFLPNASTLNASYSPSAADLALGTTTLTLTPTGQGAPCGPAIAQVLVAFNNPPLIVNPPVSVTVSAGQPAPFSVSATGAALTYQWQVSRNGGVTFTNISAAATNATYATAPTTLADDSNRYRVVVSGACPLPATSSPPAVLTVDPVQGLPLITTQPQSCSTHPGGVVSFTAYATNATGYQWRFNGVDIPGATGSTLFIANAQLTEMGYYIAIATNVNGWVPSDKAYLSVVGDPGVVPFSNIGFAPLLYAPANSVAQLVVGPELDQMQPVPELPWLPPPHPTNTITAIIANGYYDYGDVVSVPAVSPGQTVYYRVDACYTNYGIIETRPVSRVLTLVAGGDSYPTPSVSAIQFPGWFIGEGTEPVLCSLPIPDTNQVHSPGESITLTAAYFCYMDFGPPHFQWRKDGAIIPGATNFTGGPDPWNETGGYSPFFTITNAQAADAGNYDLIVNGSYSFIDVNTSLSIRFTNSAVPVLITSQPADLAVCAGSPASFTVTATGTNLVYQWQVSQDGGATFANVSASATNAAYTNLNATLADNGKRYQVIVTSSGISQTSSPPALLTVNAPATAGAGANQTVCAGSATAALGGSVGSGATGGVWTTAGTGTFLPNASTLNASYSPSAADVALGATTLTLTSTGQGVPCAPATAQVLVTYNNPPLVVDPPVITTHPQSCRTQPGVAVSFTAYSPNATGYQWRFNGVDIPGATGSTLFIANPQPTNSGYYIAIATNAGGWVPSQKAYLAVVGDQGVVPFSNVGFAEVLSEYNWPNPLNGAATLVAGPELDQMQPVPDPWAYPQPATAAIVNGYYDYGDVVSVPTVSPGQTVYYRVDISETNAYGSYTRPSKVLALAAGGGFYPTPSVSTIEFPAYIEWPDPGPANGDAPNQYVAPGGSVTLTAQYYWYGVSVPYYFQWRKDGVIIPGATNYYITSSTMYYHPYLIITNASAVDAGNYDLIASGDLYAFTDVNTSLSIRFTNSSVPVLIASQPADLTVCAGSPASFTVTTAGTNLGYQWQVSQDGGATFANVSATDTNAAYTNLNATLADSGNRYQVIVTGPGLSQTSSPPALLTVRVPATASAGANQTISAYSNTLPLGGRVGGCAAGGVWTTAGTGTFSPSATALNACYAPSSADLAAGTVTLTLTSTGPCAPCPAGTAQVVVTVQWQPLSLGTTTLLEGPSAGADSVVLAAAAPTNTWTATANDAWLHLDTANQSGTGSTNVIFSYDANAGTNRNGTLTIAGQTLTVTQAGSTYVAASSAATTLASSGLGNPWYVDVDGTGSVYIADGANDAIKRWTPMNNSVNTVVTLATNSVAVGVAVDGAGNVYMSDQGDNTLKVWSAANHAWSTLVSSGLNTPYAIAVDWVGNVYIADTGNNAIKAWTVANNSVTTLAGTASMPYGVGVDRAGNVYFPDGNSIKKWTAANNSVATLASRSGYYFYGVAVDGAGNVHYSATAPPGLKVIGKWKAASNTFTTLVSSGLQIPRGVAVDGADNVYFTDVGYGTIKELPRVFLDPTAKTEGPAAGSDVLLPVLPATANLLTPFAPTSDQPWLTITGVTNGVVSFSFTANTGSPNRTANITLLGQAIAVTQTALTPPTLIGPPLLSNGTFQFAFSNNDLGATFTVLTATNLWLPLSNWTVVGPATNTAPGLFQFSTGTTNYPQGFYRVRSP